MMTSREKEIKEYLETVRKVQSEMNSKNTEYPFISIEDFVLKNGQLFRTDPSIKVKRGQMKDCFMNAQRLAEGKGYRYVEGYAAGIIPMLHGWVVDENGTVIDPTWKDHDAVYFGVVIPIEYVWKANVLRKAYGVLDAWDIGFPLLTGEHKLDDYEVRGTAFYRP